VKNKLFFFSTSRTSPTRTRDDLRANNGGETVAGNTTRVARQGLDALSSFMKSKFNYDTGPTRTTSSRRPRAATCSGATTTSTRRTR